MNYFFDLLIFGFLICDLLFFLWLRKNKKGHKHFLLITVSILIAWGVIFYGSFLEPKKIIVKEEFISLNENTENSIRIAVLSDIHVGPYKDAKYVEQLVQIILEQEPQYVFILGDFIYKSKEALRELTPLSELTKKVTTYAVLGNHDYDLKGYEDEADMELAKEVKAALLDVGVITMENESYPIATRELWISGVKEIWTNEGSVQTATGNRPPATSHTILLTHNPDIVQEITPEDKIDLVLAGHTHGGQIRLPLIGPIGSIPDELGQYYDKGWFDYDDTKLFITSGVGESGPRARLFNKPEIILLTVEY